MVRVLHETSLVKRIQSSHPIHCEFIKVANPFWVNGTATTVVSSEGQETSRTGSKVVLTLITLNQLIKPTTQCLEPTSTHLGPP